MLPENNSANTYNLIVSPQRIVLVLGANATAHA